MDSHLEEFDGNVFPTPLQDCLVKCISVEDAYAVETAMAILSNGDYAKYSTFHLGRLAATLKRYEWFAAADARAQLAASLRAEQLLAERRSPPIAE